MPSATPVRVAIDIETTGLQVESDSIIEIGAVRFRGTAILDSFETFVEPRRALPYRIQRLTHITPAMLAGAPAFSAIAPTLRALLGDAPLVGHSVGFDATFLRKMRLAERNALLDTFELASLLLPTLGSYSLDSVAAHLGLSAPQHHRALADALLARDVLLALEARIVVISGGGAVAADFHQPAIVAGGGRAAAGRLLSDALSLAIIGVEGGAAGGGWLVLPGGEAVEGVVGEGLAGGAAAARLAAGRRAAGRLPGGVICTTLCLFMFEILSFNLYNVPEELDRFIR
jgi:DNA polymerase III epsilon subunit family exonuclease